MTCPKCLETWEEELKVGKVYLCPKCKIYFMILDKKGTADVCPDFFNPEQPEHPKIGELLFSHYSTLVRLITWSGETVGTKYERFPREAMRWDPVLSFWYVLPDWCVAALGFPNQWWSMRGWTAHEGAISNGEKEFERV